MPKCTTDQIKLELSKLEGSGLVCAVIYLKAELKRREGSSLNTGRPVKDSTETRKKWREAKAVQRRNKRLEIIRAIEAEGVRIASETLPNEPEYLPIDET